MIMGYQKICPRCNHIMPEDSAICSRCGCVQNPIQKSSKKWVYIAAVSVAVILSVSFVSKLVSFNGDNNSSYQESVQTTTRITTTKRTTEKQETTATTEAIEEYKELDIVDIQYNKDEDDLYYYVKIKNPNSTYCFKPTARIIARDENGVILNTSEEYLPYILPNSEIEYIGRAFEMESNSDDISFEILDEKKQEISSTKYKEYKEPELINYALYPDEHRFAGELKNNNDYDMTFHLQLIFKDSSGNPVVKSLINSERIEVDANSTEPFSTMMFSYGEDYDVYIYPANW